MFIVKGTPQLTKRKKKGKAGSINKKYKRIIEPGYIEVPNSVRQNKSVSPQRHRKQE